MFANVARISLKTLVELRDLDTDELLVSKSNDIHPQNMARVIARGLSNEPDHNIHLVALGNGGTFIDSAGIIKFNQPHIDGVEATLYNQTYFEIVDGTEQNGNDIHSEASISDDKTSTIIIDMTLDQTEPTGQWLTDAEGVDQPQNPLTGGYDFEFDELGCFAKNPLYDPLNPTAQPEFLLLTHLIFQPIAKTQNRRIQLTYTITVSVA